MTGAPGSATSALRRTKAPFPDLGVGMGFRRDISDLVIQHIDEFDCLEVVCDSFFRAENVLRALKALRPVVPHSLAMSVGSEVDETYLANVRRVVELSGSPWYGDHLCFTRAGGYSSGHLTPLPWNDEALGTVVANVKRVMAAIGPNFALENIANPFVWPTSTMTEPEFIGEVVRRTGCLLLLDVENVRVNAANHGFDARRFIADLPLERVVQVHIAGGAPYEHLVLDSHSRPVPEETWALLAYLLEHHRPSATILEHDEQFPPFAELVAEVRRARSILRGAAA